MESVFTEHVERLMEWCVSVSDYVCEYVPGWLQGLQQGQLQAQQGLLPGHQRSVV